MYKKSLKEYLVEEGKEAILEMIMEPNPDKISFSTAKKKVKLKCPDCKKEFKYVPNKLNRIKLGKSIKNIEKRTYCPYCKGEKASEFYNLKLLRPDIAEMFDETMSDLDLENLMPDTHENIPIRCKKCGWTKTINPHSTKNVKCEKCSFKSLANFTAIAKEYDSNRNGDTPDQVKAYSHEKKWWKCSKGHRYLAKVSNRVSLDRGCPRCMRMDTSFAENVYAFYFEKIEEVVSNQIDSLSGKSIDILMPNKKIAIEYNSEYHHKSKIKKDKEKINNLSNYYKTIVLAEEGVYELMKGLDDGKLVRVFKSPSLEISRQDSINKFEEHLILLLRKLFPDNITIPNVNIKKDEIKILNRFKKDKVVKNSIENKNPSLAVRFDTSKNLDLQPENFNINSKHMLYWVCEKCGESFRSCISNMNKTGRSECDKCKHEKNSIVKLFPIIYQYWDNVLNDEELMTLGRYSEKEIILTNGNKILKKRVDKLCSELKVSKNQSKTIESMFEA